MHSIPSFLSGFLLKLRFTLCAGNLYQAFSFWQPKLLSTLRAFKEAVYLALFHFSLYPTKPDRKGVPKHHKSLVLGYSFAAVTGKHTVKTDNDTRHIDKVEEEGGTPESGRN